MKRNVVSKNSWNRHRVREGSWNQYNTPDKGLRKQIDFLQLTGHTWAGPETIVDRKDFDSLLVAVTLSGEGYLTTRGETHALVPNELYWLDCREHHVYGPKESEWESVFVHIGGVNVRNMIQLYQERISQTCGGLVARRVQSLILDIQTIMQKEPAGLPRDLYLHARILGILSELAGINYPSIVPGVVHDALDWMEAHFAQPFSLEAMAASVGRSKYHLARLFKSYTGESPARYLIQMRIDKSKKLLLDDERSLDAIAEETGFSSASSYIAHFKEQEQVTPGRFRRGFLGKERK